MAAPLQKTDSELKADVLAELKCEPKVDIADIGVLVKGGTVILNGFVTNYGEKWNAVQATKRIAGIIAIADDIEVRIPNSHHRTDGEIAAAVANQINWCMTVPKNSVDVRVSHGRVTLTGQQEWGYQKTDAEGAAHQIPGVTHVDNLMTIKPDLAAGDVKMTIGSAFRRSAILDVKHIHVTTSGNEVTLSGTAPHYCKRDEAERVARAAPGVVSVDNQLKISLL